MVTIQILQDPEFQKELSRFTSSNLDKLIDQILQSIDESYLSASDQFPSGNDLQQSNVCRIALKQNFEKLKSSNSLNSHS